MRLLLSKQHIFDVLPNIFARHRVRGHTIMEIAVQKEVLEWALARAGKAQDQLEQDFPKLNQWLSGENGPSLPQLRQLANKLHLPLGFLLLQKPPELKLPLRLFRTRGDGPIQNPSTELIDTLYAMERRQSWLRDYFINEGMSELSFVGSCNINDETAVVTDRMRKVLKLQQNWAAEYQNKDEAIKALRSSIEKSGVFVFSNGIVRNNTHRKLNVNEFLGFVMCDKYAPIIFVNNADFKAAQIFTLAHEFAHVMFGLSAAFDLDELQPANDPGEKACNAVAAEFLVPGEALSQYRASLQQSDFQSAASAFKVSEIVIARRALDGNIIERSQFFKFYNEYRERERSQESPGGGNFYNSQNSRVGKYFATILKKALGENKIMHREAYSLTGLYGKTFDNYLFES